MVPFDPHPLKIPGPLHLTSNRPSSPKIPRPGDQPSLHSHQTQSCNNFTSWRYDIHHVSVLHDS
ncbi:hypothetical protein EX30DRAFT_161335 [Ascodesmis nigricans]|uniref:Uncharacterized protein n=1 Tax=Ascodesmis nigricans TaxID=341454 RepID=A0A4S2MR92_9PEZI|nr:hypothetical protein EX30DRAFT_161335 [Ascodesmis nigricans]